MKYPLYAQTDTINYSYVDEQGVLRWSRDNREIHAFGVNYSLPFAHAYRMAKRLGVNHEEAIRQDVYHFARLDFDLYRVHVWDTEISDAFGNLLQNEHLRLFDYLINEMKKRGMKFVITPIAYWGNGWPEPDEPTPGFSALYGKEGSLVIPQAMKAQENYLIQFLNHVNHYTGIAYKDDPDIIAFEVSNEPHHPGTVGDVKIFINRMVSAMRSTGTRTPIFYNMSHSIHLYRAYMEADVQGGTFQWYPTNLVARRQIEGNFLPHVDNYFIPFEDDADFVKKAKLVYEFDAADVAGNYMYPAMARSFRQAGMQVAAHFDYDAMFLAPYNTNYGTHFMSLPYAPQKALSLKIASAVFHEMPRYTDYGSYPDNNRFGNFRVDYESNLSEYISPTRFFYSNHTASPIPDVAGLKEIAGYGNSVLVQYDGKGAYFLDQLEPGVWRLEVMPDAHWIGDPYARTSPSRQVAAVAYTRRSMAVRLPDLGDEFNVRPVNDGNNFTPVVSSRTFDIMPGVYILQALTNNSLFPGDSLYRNIRINEYVAPVPNLDTIMVKNLTPLEHTAGLEVIIRFEVISAYKPSSVAVSMWGEAGSRQINAGYKGNDIYEAVIPAEATGPGIGNYFITINLNDTVKTFPSGNKGRPGDWDFYDHTTYRLHFVSSFQPLLLWNAFRDDPETMRPWNRNINMRPVAGGMDGRLYFILDSVPAYQDGAGMSNIYSFKFNFRDKVKGRKSELEEKEYLVIKGRNTGVNPVRLIVGLIDKTGNTFTHDFILEQDKDEYQIPLNSLEEGKFAMIPRPYPEFMPWYAATQTTQPLQASDLESLQVSLLPADAQNNKEVEFYISEIFLTE